MNRFATLAAATAAVALLSGVSLSQGLGGIAPPAEPAAPVEPAPPAPPPPPVAPPPPAPITDPTLVKSVNLAFIKSIFDRAGIPATIEKTNDGSFNYVAATVGGNFMATAPLDCRNSDPNGECASVVILSGTMPVKLTPAQISEYTQNLQLATPLLVGQGEPMLRYAFLVNDGIGPNYVEGTLVAFKNEMDSFADWVGKTKKGPGSSFSTADSATVKFGATTNLGTGGSVAKGGKLTP
jgi:hypothetical protein